jgi:S1-C subfamily serine protease
VGEVSSGGPAADAGVREGDIVLSLDGAAVTGTDDLIRLLGADRIGRDLTLEVLRDGKVDKVTVRAVERQRQAA